LGGRTKQRLLPRKKHGTIIEGTPLQGSQSPSDCETTVLDELSVEEAIFGASWGVPKRAGVGQKAQPNARKAVSRKNAIKRGKKNMCKKNLKVAPPEGYL